MNEPFKTIAAIPCERGGSFEVREVYMRKSLCMQLHFENQDGRTFSRFIFSNQVEPLLQAIQLFLNNRNAEQADNDY